MDYFALILKVLDPALNFLALHEQNKYRDQMIRIKRDYYNEKSKPDPDMGVLDDLEFELHVLCDAFAATAGAAAPKNPSG